MDKIKSFMTISVLLSFLTAFSCKQENVVLAKPAPVDEYAIHEDGGIVYNPLYREAKKTGQSECYKNVPSAGGQITLDKFKLDIKVPANATAYDVIPIDYTLTWDANDTNAGSFFPVAVEAVAFEDEKQRQKQDLFDLALPDEINLDVEFLGSITAHLDPNARHRLSPDFSDKPKEYPPFTRKPMVRSGVVEAGNLVWFKFRYTNTGNTILDPEGYGGFQFWPRILKKTTKETAKDAGDEYVAVGEPYNLFVRDLEYLYPGQSHEIWMHCTGSMPGYAEDNNATPQGFGLSEGMYLFQLRVIYRCYKTDDFLLNLWDGPVVFTWEMPFRIEKKPRQIPIYQGHKVPSAGEQPDKITRFIHTFEEFMTSFDCHLKKPADNLGKISGTLHLQVAPWTEQVVVKLIHTNPVSIKTAAVSIAVDSKSLEVKFNPESKAVAIKDGMRQPLITSQTMADMRTNVQTGPFPEKHISQCLDEMMDCGINVVSTTAMPWLYDKVENAEQTISNYQGDAYKYVLDVARKKGILIEGWGTYPYNRASVGDIAGWITGKRFNLAQTECHYSAISYSDPLLPVANAITWLYQFHRWGDLYYQLERGDVPISVEDTRGWMRQDINVRYPVGDDTIEAFREWLREKYKTIESVNEKWGTVFGSFNEINPQKNQVTNPFSGYQWEYTNTNNPFHDWNEALEDFDIFRTELRVKNYRETLAVVRNEIPNAVINIRTEGGNILVSGIDPEDPNPHFRHIYYSQRRCALIADVIQKSGIVTLHSDYTTLPYTPSELRQLVRKSVQQGIIPAYLPQFDNMRDMAVNKKYGTDYTIHYNLSEPGKAYMMHCLTALFPWFKIIYEEGGIPGILWEDYQCDGFATETQKREMRLFRQQLQQAISTPEAIKARKADIKEPSQKWREKSRALQCYKLSNLNNPE